MVVIILAIIIAFLVISNLPLLGLILLALLGLIAQYWMLILGGICVLGLLGLLGVFLPATKNDSRQIPTIFLPYKELITNLDMLINQEDALIIAVRSESHDRYKPLTNYTLLANTSDLVLLNNTEKYLIEIMTAQNKYSEFFSNTAVTFLEAEIEKLAINEHLNQLKGNYKRLFFNKLLSSRTELSSNENRLDMIQNRIKQLAG